MFSEKFGMGHPYLDNCPLRKLIYVIAMFRVIEDRLEHIQGLMFPDATLAMRYALRDITILPACKELAAFLAAKDLSISLMRDDSVIENDLIPALMEAKFPATDQVIRNYRTFFAMFGVKRLEHSYAKILAKAEEIVQELLQQRLSDNSDVKTWTAPYFAKYFRKNPYAVLRLIMEAAIQELRISLCEEHLGERYKALFGPSLDQTHNIVCRQCGNPFAGIVPELRKGENGEEFAPQREYFVVAPLIPLLSVFALTDLIVDHFEQHSGEDFAKAQTELKTLLAENIGECEAELIAWCVKVELGPLCMMDGELMACVTEAATDETLFPLAKKFVNVLDEFAARHGIFSGKDDGEFFDEVYHRSVVLLHRFATMFAWGVDRSAFDDAKRWNRSDWDEYFDYFPSDELAIVIRFAIEHCRAVHPSLWRPTFSLLYGPTYAEIAKSGSFGNAEWFDVDQSSDDDDGEGWKAA